MTGQPNDDEPTPTGPYDGGPAVLSGELVRVEDSADGGQQRRHFTAEPDFDLVEAVIRERIKGRTLKSVSEQYSVSIETVRRWTHGAINTNIGKQAEVAKRRSKIALEFDALRHEAWRMFEEHDHAGVRRDALARIESCLRALAVLEGLNAPTAIKAEVQVTEVTQEDLAIQDMISQAKAQTAAKISAVEAEFRADS